MLRRVIPCDHAGYNAIDVASRRATIVADPAECVFDGGPEVLARFGDQNPLIPRGRNGAGEVMRLSDFISTRALHLTDLYAHVYKVIGLEYQLGVALPSAARPTETVGVSLARSRRDFAEHERVLLQFLRPHLGATLERLRELALLRAIISEEIGDPSRALLLLDSGSTTIAWASDGAQQTLEVLAGDQLPPPLDSWLVATRDSQDARTGRMCLGDRWLTVKLVPDAYPELDAVSLVLEPFADPRALRRLGLTRRQAEVLALAIEGRTAGEIAERLVLSRRTVEKHFERIYDRLGVSNRSQAIVAAARGLRL
jgi:DNA-binding CsgD family transcriptional regulator